MKNSEEVRMVDPVTGAEKGSKMARFDLLPTGPLWELAEHYGKGSRKYADHNWARGYRWSLSYAALMRHLLQFWAGEDYDDHFPECPPDCTAHTGSKHIIAVAWHAMALAEFMDSHPELDDRRKATKENS